MLLGGSPILAVADSPVLIENSIGLKLTRIPSGEFYMGGAKKDPGVRPDEQPRHAVRISKPFNLGIYEVTQGEFQSVMGVNNSFYSNTGPIKDQLSDFDCSHFPVDGITWYQAVEFCPAVCHDILTLSVRVLDTPACPNDDARRGHELSTESRHANSNSRSTLLRPPTEGTRPIDREY